MSSSRAQNPIPTGPMDPPANARDAPVSTAIEDLNAATGDAENAIDHAPPWDANEYNPNADASPWIATHIIEAQTQTIQAQTHYPETQQRFRVRNKIANCGAQDLATGAAKDTPAGAGNAPATTAIEESKSTTSEAEDTTDRPVSLTFPTEDDRLTTPEYADLVQEETQLKRCLDDTNEIKRKYERLQNRSNEVVPKKVKGKKQQLELEYAGKFSADASRIKKTVTIDALVNEDHLTTRLGRSPSFSKRPPGMYPQRRLERQHLSLFGRERTAIGQGHQIKQTKLTKVDEFKWIDGTTDKRPNADKQYDDRSSVLVLAAAYDKRAEANFISASKLRGFKKILDNKDQIKKHTCGGDPAIYRDADGELYHLSYEGCHALWGANGSDVEELVGKKKKRKVYLDFTHADFKTTQLVRQGDAGIRAPLMLTDEPQTVVSFSERLLGWYPQHGL